LACDGHNNCPAAGDDENPEVCEAMGIKGGLFLADPNSSEEGHQSNPHHIIEAILKKAVLKTLTEVKSGKRDATSTTTTSQPGLMTLMFRDMSDIIMKKLLSKGEQLAEPRNSTTISTTTKPPWEDSPEGKPLLFQYTQTRSS
jgi:hypothetical protein